MTFKELRKRTGCTTEYISKLLKIKKGTYQKYENFARLPSATILTQMPNVYKCTAEEVMCAYNKSKEVRNGKVDNPNIKWNGKCI